LCGFFNGVSLVADDGFDAALLLFGY